MFTSPVVTLIFAASGFFCGAVIGVAVCASIYKRRFDMKLGVKAGLFGGIAFLLTLIATNWADSHAAFQDGKRLSTAPWGEDLRFRNFLADNQLVLTLTSASVAGLLAGLRGRNPSTNI